MGQAHLVCFVYCPAPEPAISPRSSGFFYGKMVFGNQDLALGVLISTGVSLLVDTARKCTCVYPNPRVNTQL